MAAQALLRQDTNQLTLLNYLGSEYSRILPCNLFFEIKMYKKENTTEQAKAARWVVALRKYIILYGLY